MACPGAVGEVSSSETRVETARPDTFGHLPNNIYQTPPVTPEQQPAGAVNRPRPRSVSPVPSTSSISTERAFSILLDRFEALDSKVSEKFNVLESKIPTLVENSLLDQVKKESLQDVTPKLNKESKITSISNSSIHSRESQVTRKKSTMKIRDPQSFDGNLDNLHPRDFIKNLVTFFDYHNVHDSDRLDHMYRFLKGEAMIWFRARQHFSSFKDFEDEFFKFYWGPAEQSSIAASLYAGRYSDKDKLASYFLKYMRDLQFLDEPISDSNIIAAVLTHFPRDVQQHFTQPGENTIDSELAKLQRLDKIRKTGSKKGVEQPKVFTKKFVPQPQRVSCVENIE
ncbi:unnamed protein product [Bemisia tabaci]|uniref:Ty3 transposon capsid-like protein domain-containing protein n=1 Tax=Bemisia tabaci TaxID=7038 RepID=A0A9P0A7K7_BEMTA|nr:unnamed protein product [Bemisia tabaci]